MDFLISKCKNIKNSYSYSVYEWIIGFLKNAKKGMFF